MDGSMDKHTDDGEVIAMNGRHKKYNLIITRQCTELLSELINKSHHYCNMT